jgi:hypothetical protein
MVMRQRGDEIAKESNPNHAPRCRITIYFCQHIAHDVTDWENNNGSGQNQTKNINQLDRDDICDDEACNKNRRDQQKPL